MARRSDGLFGDIVETTAKFPWWVGVFFALVSFLFLNWYAGKELSVAVGADGILSLIHI
jgi:hypothetical protein